MYLQQKTHAQHVWLWNRIPSGRICLWTDVVQVTFPSDRADELRESDFHRQGMMRGRNGTCVVQIFTLPQLLLEMAIFKDFYFSQQN